MEELTAIKTADGREFKPWASKDDLQAAVQDPSSVTAITSEIASGKQAVAEAINAKGGTASATESLIELAQDIQDIPTSGVLSGGIVQSEPFNFLDYVCKKSAYPFTEIYDDSVTVIDRHYAFYFQVSLLKVRMSALTTIKGNSAFESCSALQSFTLSALTTISGNNTFQSCSALQSVTLSALTTISSYNTFYNCSSLQSVTLSALTTISDNSTFYNCSSLQSVTLSALTTISGNSTFQSCSALQSVEFGTLVAIVNPFQNSKPNLRNITIGQDTDVDLPFQNWTAINVSFEELNNNLYNNLLTKLYDHSNDGVTRTLRIGWLANVSAENIAYANAKGWTLTI